jgi:hypothetical protein
MKGRAKNLSKKSMTLFSRAIAGAATGVFFEPIAANGKVCTTILEECVMANEHLNLMDYASFLTIAPATSTFGIFYGLLRGAQLGIQFRDEKLGQAEKKIIKELFTYDPEVMSEDYLSQYTQKQAEKKAHAAGVSLREFDASVFFQDKKNKRANNQKKHDVQKSTSKGLSAY